MQWTGTIWTIIEEEHLRIIPAKYGQNQASSLGGDVLWSYCYPRITKAHIEPRWAKNTSLNKYHYGKVILIITSWH